MFMEWKPRNWGLVSKSGDRSNKRPEFLEEALGMTLSLQKSAEWVA